MQFLEEKDFKKELSKKKEYLDRARKDKEYADFVENLAFEEYVYTIKKLPNVWKFFISNIDLSINEIGKKQKVDRKNLSMVEEKIKNDYFDGKRKIKINIVKIITLLCGAVAGYYLYFTVKGLKKEDKNTYFLFIPVRENLNTENFNSSSYMGRFVFGKDKTDNICSSFFEEEIEEFVKYYFNEGDDGCLEGCLEENYD